jgi:hypothetical protein
MHALAGLPEMQRFGKHRKQFQLTRIHITPLKATAQAPPNQLIDANFATQYGEYIILRNNGIGVFLATLAPLLFL